MTSRLEVDMACLLHERIHAAVRDVLDTARRGGLPADERMAMVLTVLMAETMTGLITAKHSEAEALELCAVTYRSLAEQLAEKLGEPRAKRRR